MAQELDLQLVIKAKADQAKAEVAAVNAEAKKLQTEQAAAASASAKEAAATTQAAVANQALAESSAVATAATAAQTEATLSMRAASTGAVREYRALIDEILSGRMRQATGSFAKLVSVLGFMTPAVIATIGAIAGLTAVLGGVAYAEYEAEKTGMDFARAIGASGAATGVTRSQLMGYADDLTGANTTVGQARQAILALTASGRFYGQEIEQAGRASLDFATLTGKSIEDSVKVFEELRQKPFETLEKFPELWNRVSESVREHVQRLEEEGRADEAARVALDALSPTLNKEAQDFEDLRGPVEKATDAVRRFFSALFNTGGGGDAKKTIADLRSELAGLQKAVGNTNPFTRVSGDAELAGLERIAAIKRELVERANAEGDANRRNQQIIDQDLQTVRNIAQAHDKDLANRLEVEKVENAIADARKRGAKTIDVGHGPESLDAAQARVEALIKVQEKARAGGESYMQQMRDQLARLEEADQVSFDQRLQFEAQFWSKKLTTLNHGSKEYAEVLRTAQQLQHQIDAQTVAQAKQQLDQSVRQANEAAQQQVEIKRNLLQEKLQLGEITSAQEIAGEKALQEELYQTELTGLRQRMTLLPRTLAEHMALYRQLEALDQQHQLKMQQIDNQGALAVQRAWERMLQPISQAFDQTVKGMIEGTQSLRQGLANILDSILAGFVDMEVKTLVKHIATEAAKTSATAAGTASRASIEAAANTQSLAASAAIGLKQILNDAWKAAAAAFNATAEIPVVGPVLAPAAGAAAFAAVAAFGGNIASAAGGYWELPSDQLVFAHEREMILPSRFAEGLRNLIANGGAAASGPSHTTINAVDAASLTRLLKRNPAALAAGLRSVRRNGSFR